MPPFSMYTRRHEANHLLCRGFLLSGETSSTVYVVSNYEAENTRRRSNGFKYDIYCFFKNHGDIVQSTANFGIRTRYSYLTIQTIRTVYESHEG